MEVKTYTTGIRTYRIMGGARETTYDDFNQAVKRMRNIAKKGKKIEGIHYNMDDNTYVIVMCNETQPTTMGYQRAFYCTYDGKKYVGMEMRYQGFFWNIKNNGMIPF